MTKQLVETTGDFQLVDFGNRGHVIQSDRPTVTEQTAFVSSRAALGQIRYIATLTDEATDEEFAKYVDETPEDIDFAIEAFKSAFAPEEGSSKRKPKSEETEDVVVEEQPKRQTRQKRVEEPETVVEPKTE